MRKNISAFIFILIFCISLVTPAFAADTDNLYIIDDAGYLSKDEASALNKQAKKASEKIGVNILLIYTKDDDMDKWAEKVSPAESKGQILMIENQDYWDIYKWGTAKDLITETDEETIRKSYDKEKYYYDGAAAYITATEKLIQKKSETSISDESKTSSSGNNETSTAESIENIPEGMSIGNNNTLILDQRTRMVDMADVLSDSEESDLLSKLDNISEKQNMDVIIVTVTSLDGKTREEYADDFYDYNGYGYGEDCDGLLLLVNVNSDGSYSTEHSWISTCGFGITSFTDAGIQFIGKKITPYLLDSNYNDAFDRFITWSDDFIVQAKNGDPYDVGNLPKEAFPVQGGIFGSLIIGFILASICTKIMKGKLKSVQFQPDASDYMRKGSLHLTNKSDTFMYSRVERTERSTSDDSDSGGSSTHESSSGTTHGGGGF
ncbi:MAG: TPM domain-containing protein [Oscillospiraceae bacterium]